MKISLLKMNLVGLVLALLVAASSADGQIYHLTNWVNDPYCLNPNYDLTWVSSNSPSFTNNGDQRGSLFANSPIGSTLKLTTPGDSISFTGQVAVAGNVNADGNLQFRLGLYYQGEVKGDTNWLGYMFANVTGTGSDAAYSLFIRNHPNSGNYGAVLYGVAEGPKCDNVSYVPKWGAGSYDFVLTVTLLPDHAHKIAWKLAGTPPLEYQQSGVYTNTVAGTFPPAFDQVGFLAGAAIFQSAITNNSITLKDANVTFSPAPETHH